MKKILLIEDRPERQKLFMGDTKIDLTSYSDILDNITDNKYKTLLEELKNNTFNFDEYETIISHKSAFDDDNRLILNKIKNHCKASKKQLIFFSGGISANYYDNTEYEFMELNSKVFYSKHLKLFLEDARKNKPNILILSYGNKWKLDTLLNVIEKINYFINTNNEEDILYTEFENKTDLNYLSNFDYYKPKIEDDWIDLEEIKKVKNSIETHIKQEALNA